MKKLLLSSCVAVLILGCYAAASAAPVGGLMINKQGAWYRADQQLTGDVFGKTIKAAAGSLLDLALAENASTGYSWRCSCQPAGAVTVVRSTSVESGKNLPGAGGTRHFLLLVNRAGQAKVTLQYGRWWNHGDRQPVKTFTIQATGKPTQ